MPAAIQIQKNKYIFNSIGVLNSSLKIVQTSFGQY